jgi:cobalt-precorrin 5A hydrolase
MAAGDARGAVDMGEAVIAAGLAIGVGCRRGHPYGLVVALVERARALLPQTMATAPARLCTLDGKDDDGLRQAAAALGLQIVYLPLAALREAEPRIETPSLAAKTRFGIASVSEAAALALAGPTSRLVVPRISDGGATCAIAAAMEIEGEAS